MENCKAYRSTRSDDNRLYYYYDGFYWCEGRLLAPNRTNTDPAFTFCSAPPATLLSVLILAIRAVAKSGGHYLKSAVEGRCLYHRGGPRNCGCIIGQGMGLMGLPVPISSEHLSVLLGVDFGIEYQWLSEVQRLQDMGVLWREAIIATDRLYPQPEPPAVQTYVTTPGTVVSLCNKCASEWTSASYPIPSPNGLVCAGCN